MQGPSLEEFGWEKFKGQVVVLEFWNTRCGPCVRAIPHWNELVNQFTNKPVIFLSVTDDNPDSLKDFLKTKPMKGWMAIDGPLTATRTAFDVEGIPHTVLIGKAGKIAAITHPAQLMAKHLDELLAGKPSSLPPPKKADDDDEVIPVATPTQKIFQISISGPFPQPNEAFNSRGWDKSHNEFTAKRAYLRDALASYFNFDQKFVISASALPNDLYDITVSGPTNKSSELQKQFTAAIQISFGLIVRTNNRVLDLYEMTFAMTNAPNLKPASKGGGGGGEPGGFLLRGSQMKTIAAYLAEALNKPVLDETHSTNLWSAEIKWEMRATESLQYRIYKQLDHELAEKILGDTPPDLQTLQTVSKKISAEDFQLLKTELAKPEKERYQPDPEKVVTAAREQLGLQLILTNRLVPILEITKVKK
ncbi:MAG: TlpA family protein disulfide reductase [Verrucomicrobiota bacterium]|nr:TlpA family protein disulfide reductase [Verrucomicrobiota bacterium]